MVKRTTAITNTYWKKEMVAPTVSEPDVIAVTTSSRRNIKRRGNLRGSNRRNIEVKDDCSDQTQDLNDDCSNHKSDKKMEEEMMMQMAVGLVQQMNLQAPKKFFLDDTPKMKFGSSKRPSQYDEAQLMDSFNASKNYEGLDLKSKLFQHLSRDDEESNRYFHHDHEKMDLFSASSQSSTQSNYENNQYEQEQDELSMALILSQHENRNDNQNSHYQQEQSDLELEYALRLSEHSFRKSNDREQKELELAIELSKSSYLL